MTAAWPSRTARPLPFKAVSVAPSRFLSMVGSPPGRQAPGLAPRLRKLSGRERAAGLPQLSQDRTGWIGPWAPGAWLRIAYGLQGYSPIKDAYRHLQVVNVAGDGADVGFQLMAVGDQSALGDNA